ncbi:alpha/beta hydrolase [Plastoroseomonas arctica]|uniref:Alpha/beta hydrolase n=1 Tax=Plastoroseomonas arctica TaxID=1509237 RepID=A0AAF1KQE1_9PROT|nr:alpha/beta hydrolase [Plastoroseomonas arctica]MBR0653517.1 alpha/beta hydrolase [Plastoroseomonas arctica]
MPDDPRWDPAMLAFQRMMEARGAGFPPLPVTLPLGAGRETTEALNAPLAQGGPAMAASGDRWLSVRGRRLLCRVHKPVLESPLPLLVYIHGGGWVWNSVDTHDRLMRGYAAGAGCMVVGPDYSLSPEARFPVALEECAEVVRQLARGGAEWGIDPARIVLGGDSAGANLALGVALLLRETDPDIRLAGLLVNYGVLDSATDTPSYREFAEGFTLTQAKMRFYWECYCLDPSLRVTPFAAPLRADLRGLPPVLVHIAELDVLAGENHAFIAKLREAGVGVEHAVFAGTIHGFLRALGQVPAADRAVAEASDWLRRVMR